MSNKTLPALEGTEYVVEVERDGDGDYIVSVYKPGLDEDFEPGMELVGREVLYIKTPEALNTKVEAIIAKDVPSLVGTYIAAPTEEIEETN